MFLLKYRSTPHSTTLLLFLQRDLRTRLSLLKSDPASHVTNRQSKMKSYYDQHAKPREFCPGQTVLARDFRSAQKGQPATILERKAPYSSVICHNGMMWYRHADHLLQHNPNLDQVTISEDNQRDITSLLPHKCDPKQTLTSPLHSTNASEGYTTTTSTTADATSTAASDSEGCADQAQPSETALSTASTKTDAPVITRSGRVVQPPQCYCIKSVQSTTRDSLN